MSFACSSPAGGMLFGVIIIIIIEGLSLLQSIPPTTADKQTQAQKRRGSRSRKLFGVSGLLLLLLLLLCAC